MQWWVTRGLWGTGCGWDTGGRGFQFVVAVEDIVDDLKGSSRVGLVDFFQVRPGCGREGGG